MAKQKQINILGGDYAFEDLYNVADELDTKKRGAIKLGTETETTVIRDNNPFTRSDVSKSNKDLMASNSDELASILGSQGKTDAQNSVLQNKKKRAAQSSIGSSGLGGMSSILGGSNF